MSWGGLAAGVVGGLEGAGRGAASFSQLLAHFISQQQDEQDRAFDRTARSRDLQLREGDLALRQAADSRNQEAHNIDVNVTSAAARGVSPVSSWSERTPLPKMQPPSRPGFGAVMSEAMGASTPPIFQGERLGMARGAPGAGFGDQLSRAMGGAPDLPDMPQGSFIERELPHPLSDEEKLRRELQVRGEFKEPPGVTFRDLGNRTGVYDQQGSLLRSDPHGAAPRAIDPADQAAGQRRQALVQALLQKYPNLGRETPGTRPGAQATDALTGQYHLPSESLEEILDDLRSRPGTTLDDLKYVEEYFGIGRTKPDPMRF